MVLSAGPGAIGGNCGLLSQLRERRSSDVTQPDENRPQSKTE